MSIAKMQSKIKAMSFSLRKMIGQGIIRDISSWKPVVFVRDLFVYRDKFAIRGLVFMKLELKECNQVKCF